MLSSLLVLALAVIAPSVHATVFITNPTASTSIAAGQSFQITWQDDGTSPNVTAFGISTIGLYVGNSIQQTQLQLITNNVNVATVNSQTWTPDPTVGGNSDGYFLRFTSNSLAATNGTGNAEAFSAKFTLTGMTGTFNATVAAEMSGTVTTGGSSTPSSGSSTGLPSPSTSKPLTTTTVKSSSSPSTTSTKASSNGAGRMVVPSVIGASGVGAIVFALFI
ncbi:hypothetical protein V8E53_015643 [Lactarius tabidus]